MATASVVRWLLAVPAAQCHPTDQKQHLQRTVGTLCPTRSTNVRPPAIWFVFRQVAPMLNLYRSYYYLTHLATACQRSRRYRNDAQAVVPDLAPDARWQGISGMDLGDPRPGPGNRLPAAGGSSSRTGRQSACWCSPASSRAPSAVRLADTGSRRWVSDELYGVVDGWQSSVLPGRLMRYVFPDFCSRNHKPAQAGYGSPDLAGSEDDPFLQQARRCRRSRCGRTAAPPLM